MLLATPAWYRALQTEAHMKLTGFQKALLIIFVVTLPLVNPLLRGDGVAYYAYVRSILVQHHLRFENDWINSPWPYVDRTVDAEGRIPAEYTETGHLPNRYSVGPSMLWAPFLVPLHLVMVALGKAGASVRTDGFSKPYLTTAALATAFYGFIGLWVSFSLARRYVAERWAFMATLGMWFASGLPVYMYFNPFYSHAHSVFAAGIFLWYWNRTRRRRSLVQWGMLGLVAGLMLDVYYLNISLLLLPLLESANQYVQAWRAPVRDGGVLRRLFLANTIFCGATLVAFLPTLITRQIIYGSPFNLGYEPSSWTHPAIWQPLLSSNHGLLSWTPIVLPALVGMFLLRRYDRELAVSSLAAFVAMYYVVACHPAWHGTSSFGNRFFLSLTPLFILGLAVCLQEISRWFSRSRDAIAVAAFATSALILWNLAFIFQWGTGLVPHVGPISWRQTAYNQVMVVPARAGSALKAYFTNRSGMMKRIEQEDLDRVHNAP
jgi:hypothetical protein